MKISNRLKTISDLIKDGSKVIDIGCDHALLDIYLTIYKNCNCIASDVNDNVLKISNENVSKYNLNDKIKVIKSNGIENIDVKGDEYIVIAGMGTNTILEILSNDKFKNNNNLIIQTNNNLDLFRKKIKTFSYYIEDEKIVFENKKYYVIMYLKKGKRKYKKIEYILGPKILSNLDLSLRTEYLNYILQKYEYIYSQLPKYKFIERIKINKIKKKLKKYI